jgi:hypothetical protein
MEDRLKHCISCPHNTKKGGEKTLKLKVIWQLSKLLNCLMLYKTKDLGICKICYCPVNEKVKIKSEICSLVFINEKPKWAEEK